MTKREEEILKIIKENPLISQQELADKFGLTRSGVAAHIFNLTKKGYIAGKGYIINEPNFVTVIGGVNIDILGLTDTTLIQQNSNPGHITFSLGGAGYNIAHNLTKLAVPNYFITVYGDDLNGQKFEEDAQKNHLAIQHSKKITDKSTSSYLYVNDPDGTLNVGVDDMGIYDDITPDFLSERLATINTSAYCIIDTNLPEKTIDWLFDNCKVPIFVKTVSLNKSYKLQNVLSKIDTLMTTDKELAMLTNSSVTDAKTAEKSAKKLLKKGIEHIYVLMPHTGLFYIDNRNTKLIAGIPIKRVNNNGASAALTAAVVDSRLNNLGWEKTTQIAYTAALICMESAKSVNPLLSKDYLLKTVTRYLES